MGDQPVMIPSCVYAIDSADIIPQVMTMGCPIVTISETTDPYIAQNPNTIPAPLLLPDYQAVSAMIDGNAWQAQNLYYAQLSGEVCQEYIQIILTAAVLNKQPIYLYFDNDDMAKQFGAMLLQYLNQVYGFIAGTATNMSCFIGDARYNSLLGLLYLKGYLRDPFKDILFKLIGDPGSDMVPMALMEALIKDLNPMVENRTYESYMEYFRNLMGQMRSAGKPLIDPMEGI
ncbi:hypothetical protein [uncultured Duncaniella sp.]|uniref:hypothetical protein n=1 Tax=uncultured Duncaniella sp. TaxID=2768039 RepID=UPI00261A2CD4|nr:hypothetical protein [uncultured Duncaniella sp.]